MILNYRVSHCEEPLKVFFGDIDIIYFSTKIFHAILMEFQNSNHSQRGPYMPYLTISGLFVEIWTVCNPEEVHGNGKS